MLRKPFVQKDHKPKPLKGQHAAAAALASVMSNSLQSHGLQATKLLSPGDSPGKNAGVECHALLQGIFPIKGLNTCLLKLLYCMRILYFRATREMCMCAKSSGEHRQRLNQYFKSSNYTFPPLVQGLPRWSQSMALQRDRHD